MAPKKFVFRSCRGEGKKEEEIISESTAMVVYKEEDAPTTSERYEMEEREEGKLFLSIILLSFQDLDHPLNLTHMLKK